MGFTLIMFVLVDGYGLTSAIPLLFGSSRLLGVIIVYFMEEDKGDAWYIFSGVAILFIAVVLNTIASKSIQFVILIYSMNAKCQEKREAEKKDDEKKEVEKKETEEVTVPLVEEPEKKVFLLVVSNS